MRFNEDSRVKIPSILHVTRLGYSYLSLKDCEWEESSNIIPSIFLKSLAAINPQATNEEIEQTLKEIGLMLDNEDLGKAFYERLIESSGVRIIDFEDFNRNAFHVVTEFTCKKDDEEFRPDITLLINGLPLIFIEVKKPNNRDGILAERKRMETRFQNSRFKRFINLTQLMMFSNNMEYEDEAPEPLEGAFYGTTSLEKPILNYFREELTGEPAPVLVPLDPETEDFILTDTNLVSIKYSPEFETNKNPDTPTNRLSTSLFSRERLAFFLQYAIAYVRKEHSLEKQVMRYPQFFASKAIQQKLKEGTRNGIIWHTQGSGKTALAFYNVSILRDYYRAQGVVPKFYFIVDRIDLMVQASLEFRSRGLLVYNIGSREAFALEIKSNLAVHNDSGQAEITVVNIQRFENDPDVVRNSGYAVGLQRIYFLDEVHRSYNPQGSFLANLKQSDPQAIHIGLTGTPLLDMKLPSKKDAEGNRLPKVTYSSKTLFDGYIHKYYYNRSIADGYTLRLIRENIETNYKLELKEALDQIKLLKSTHNRTQLYSHKTFVEPMLDYIVSDFEQARMTRGDDGIGAMVICDSSEQAKAMGKLFTKKYGTLKLQSTDSHFVAHEEASGYQIPEPERKIAAEGANGLYVFRKPTVTRHALILHDVGTKQERKDQVEAFKEGKIDVLFVFNMLLTGFDAARLKKLYLGRIIKAHNLLQALTRVNRPYKSHRYGYVVDFVDIEAEFEKTNRDYFDELQSELGDELEHYSDLFKSPEEIEAEIENIKDALWKFDTQNAEIFSQQITQITDRPEMREVIQALNDARNLYNLIRFSGRYELLEKLDFRKLRQLSIEANNHLTLLNQREALQHADQDINLLNIALEDVLFTFRKVSEGEMIIADELRETLRRTREGLGGNFDPGDPAFVTLREELERLFKLKNLAEITQEEMIDNIEKLKDIHARARDLERQNQLLRAKYANDAKYARLHKRLLEKGDPTPNERKLFEALSAFKVEADQRISQNARMLTNEAFAKAEMSRIIIEQLKNIHNLPLTAESAQFINALVMKEYLDEFHGDSPA